jgi:hypothetical protein
LLISFSTLSPNAADGRHENGHRRQTGEYLVRAPSLVGSYRPYTSDALPNWAPEPVPHLALSLSLSGQHDDHLLGELLPRLVDFAGDQRTGRMRNSMSGSNTSPSELMAH